MFVLNQIAVEMIMGYLGIRSADTADTADQVIAKIIGTKDTRLGPKPSSIEEIRKVVSHYKMGTSTIRGNGASVCLKYAYVEAE